MKKLLFFLEVLSCLTLFSCQRHDEVVAPNSAASSIVTIKDAKLGAPVSLASDAMVKLVPATATDINILLKADLKQGNMRVELAPSDGLQLIGANATYNFVPNTTGEYLFKVNLSAANNGRYYLNLHVTIDNGETSSSRTLAVIVQVGEPTATAENTSKMLEKESGEKVISLPAQEHITNQ